MASSKSVEANRGPSWGLDAFLRVRRATWLSSAYRLLPEAVRAQVSRYFWRRLSRQVKFPPAAYAASKSGVASGVVYPEPQADRPGVNIFGYFSGQFGLGESARLYASALAAAGIPIAITDLDLGLPHGRENFSLPHGRVNEAPYDVDLVVVNPDYLSRAMPFVEALSRPGRHRIACWFWELETVPREWHWALDAVDEIMVASEFVESAFRRITDKPILKVPLPVIRRPDSGLARRDFGLPESAFVFLVTFDFHSSLSRKNPEAVIAAFQQAFADARDDVVLLIKSSNGHLYPELLSALVSRVKHDPRIMVRDDLLDAAHVRSLQKCCDAYVSLHRAEGFGLGMAECMAIGKPVIATAWSGNMEFMDRDNSCLVDFRLVPVADGEYPGALDAHWADADIDQAAALMARLVRDRPFATQLAARASSDVQQALSPERIAGRVAARLEQLAAARGGPSTPTDLPRTAAKGNGC